MNDVASVIERAGKHAVASRDELGRQVRTAWIEWARQQPNPKPSWLVPYSQLSEADKEADRMIGEYIATLVGAAYAPVMVAAKVFLEKPSTSNRHALRRALENLDYRIGASRDE